MELDDRRRALRDTFIEQRGFWAPPFEAMLQADPDFLQAYLDYSMVPWRNGVLEPKVKEFVYIAADASTTHLHADGTRAHIRSALKRGATREEIMEVLELVSVVGIHSCNLGVPILVEELATAGRPVPAELSERGQAAKQNFLDARGYWAPAWDGVAALDPDFLDAYVAFSSKPWKDGVLDPKVKEFVYIAADASTTHLHEIGTRGHIRSALKHGATREEIMEVLELVSVLGIHTLTLAAPILVEELATADPAAV
jgi:alkylhydroperoxidase/carboxymuconolactone decarboxylase family protein YurZ